MNDFCIAKKTFLLIPPGTYRAVIDSVEQTVGTYGNQLKITFSVFTEGIDGLEYTDGKVDLLAWCSASYSEKSKLFRWTRAAMAGDFDPNADFQASKLVHRRVLVNVDKNISANGGEFNKIIDIMAIPRDKAKQVPAPQERPLPPESPAPPDDLPW
jgi:hypothetical protein